MYKLNVVINNIYRSKFSFEEDFFYAIMITNKVNTFSKISYEGKVLDEFSEDGIFEFYELEASKFILTTNDGMKSYLLNNKKSKLLDIKIINGSDIDAKQFSASSLHELDYFYCIFDKLSLHEIVCIPTAKGNSQFDMENKILIDFAEENLWVYDITGHLKWHIDVSKSHATNDVIFGARRGQVSAVMFYKEFLIVLAGTKMMKFLIESGELVQKQEIGITISKNFKKYKNGLFYFGNRGYRIFNPETLELEVEIDLKEQFYKGKELGVDATGFTFHDGLLWYASHRYGNYLAAINPFTGEGKELLIIKNSIAALEEPHFYKDMVFISDGDHNLFIFEKGIEI